MSSPAPMLFWIAFLISAISVKPIMSLLIRLKSRQTISAFVPEHQAKQGTPTMGGMISIAGAVVAWTVADLMGVPGSWQYLAIFVAFAIVGFVDDFVVPKMFANKRGLGWKQKILMELVLALLPILFFPKISGLSIGFGLFLILFFANAYNFTDGLDGLAGSVGIGLLGGLACIAYLVSPEGSVGEISACLILIGSLIPFLFLNAPPAKVFMGDVGSLPIGAVIGVVVWRVLEGVLSSTEKTGPSSLATVGCLVLISVVMIAELIPVPIQIASVKLRKKKVFLKTPIHHAFQDMGFPETTIVWRYALVQFLLSAASVTVLVLLHPIVGFTASVSLKR